MSMKQEIETWVAALHYYDNNEFEESLQIFQDIADTSKVLFNCGVIKATLGEHETAVDYYARATSLDNYLAIAYFQSGVSYFLVGEFENALIQFNAALLYMRGNNYIDYEQLGLKYKLYSCEVLFNRGLSYIYVQIDELGMKDLVAASKEKKTPEHDVIDEAIKEKAEGYTVFSIPVGVVFRPSDAKVKNVSARDYLGKSRLVAEARARNDTRIPNITAEAWARDDRLPENISYGATKMVRTDLPRRTRQQSEPPLHRNQFPPTPPPETEKPRLDRQHSVSTLRSGSPQRTRSRSATRKPERLDLGAAAFERPPPKEQYKRPMPSRSMSERPQERVRYEPDGVNDHTQQTRERLFGAIDNDPEPSNSRQSSQSTKSNNQRDRSASRGNAYSRQGTMQSIQDHIAEEDEEEQYDSAGDSSRRGDMYRASTVTTSTTLSAAQSSYRRGGSKAPGLRRVRAKVHLNDDTRYIIISTDTPFDDFAAQVIRKYNLGCEVNAVKLTVRDEEGDMITIGDQEDWEVQVDLAKENAIREAGDIGKIEVWVYMRDDY